MYFNRNKRLLSSFTALLFLLLLLCTGCGGKVTTLNNTELLETKDVVSLLNQNGMDLKKGNNFPENRSDYVTLGITPSVYYSESYNTYYLFYPLDSYVQFVQSHEGSDSLPSNKMIEGDCLYHTEAKNIFIAIYLPGFEELMQRTDIDYSKSEQVLLAYDGLKMTESILFKKALNGKYYKYVGRSSSWEAQITTGYACNVYIKKRQGDGNDFQSDIHNSGELKLKYLDEQEPLEQVTYYGYDTNGDGIDNSSTSSEGIMGFTEVDEDGYFTPPKWFNMNSPNKDRKVIITLEWNNGRKEEIVCTWVE